LIVDLGHSAHIQNIPVTVRKPTWWYNRATESFDMVKDKIEQFGTLTSTEVLYDVKEWHQCLGIE
jgi:hypothetical protein